MTPGEVTALNSGLGEVTAPNSGPRTMACSKRQSLRKIATACVVNEEARVTIRATGHRINSSEPNDYGRSLPSYGQKPAE